MVIFVYFFLIDDGGVKIIGLVDVYDCEGSIEVIGFMYNFWLLIDVLMGKIIGKCNYVFIVF